MQFFQIPPRHNLLILPLLGMAGFVVLYILAAVHYPGGSWIDPGKVGFSFWNNYLCDLLDEVAINGQMNAGRFYARAALGVLCVSLLFLWVNLPFLFRSRTWSTWAMWVSGILAFVTTMLLSSGKHDITVRIAGLFGVIALLTVFAELRRAGYLGLMRFGYLCLFIFLGNYYIYETGSGIHSLPIIQKITFGCFIIWFVWLDLSFYRFLKNRVKDRLGMEKV